VQNAKSLDNETNNCVVSGQRSKGHGVRTLAKKGSEGQARSKVKGRGVLPTRPMTKVNR